jgi:hypothetical protein
MTRSALPLLFSLQVQQSIYLLDFQKLQGNPFSFMGLCARIITALKALSSSSAARGGTPMTISQIGVSPADGAQQ